MLVTFVVRLTARSLAQGSIVGHVIDVASGERTAIRNADDLMSVLVAACRGGDKRRSAAKSGG